MSVAAHSTPEDMSHYDNAKLGLAGILVVSILISAYRRTGPRQAQLRPAKLARMRRGTYAAIATVVLIGLQILTSAHG
jgi:hypothetical protein